MSNGETVILLQQLVDGQHALTSSVSQLVSIEAGRVEREKAQQLKNTEFSEFIKTNREPLIRVRRTQGRIDTVFCSTLSKVLYTVIIGTAAAIMSGHFTM
jgi:hypothetical protein